MIYSSIIRLKLLFYILLVLLVCFTSGAQEQIAQEVTFYVATNGNDQWSGTLPVPNTSGTDGPFVTLRQARNAVRNLRSRGLNTAYTVFVRGGIYYLNETLILDPEDSGSLLQPLVFKAYTNETPILSGAREVQGFKLYKDKIYEADLSAVVSSSIIPRQFFIDGKRQILARYPNFDRHDPIGGGYLYVAESIEVGSKRKFRCHKGDIKNLVDGLKTEVFIFPGYNYGGSARGILSVDIDNLMVTLNADATNVILEGNRYYFRNIFEELDTPGEWYYDQSNKTIYYWPINGQFIKNATIPVLQNVIEIRGKKLGNKHYGTPSNIRFEGFTFEGCDGSAVVIRDAKKTMIARCTIYNAGSNGIEIHNGFDNAAIGNDIRDIGGTGIVISAGDRKTLTPVNNRAENNYIHDTGVFEKGGASGILCRGVGNIVSHNLIHSMPRVGVWIDGNDNLIEYNHIHHVNQETQDSGIIYFGNVDWTKRGNIIRYNCLHDSGGFGRHKVTEKWQSPFDTYGIYMDDWTSGTLVYGNIVADTVNGGIFIHGGRDNNIENNIIFEGGQYGQMIYSAWPPDHPTSQKLLPIMFAKIREMGYTKYPQLSSITDISSGSKMSGNSFVRNIVYYMDKNAPLYGIHNDIDLKMTVSDQNVVYHEKLPLLVPFMKVPANLQWSVWQDKGFDQHSIIADPLLSDPIHGDYTLSPVSPALKLGFIPIPFEKIGPYNDTLRASWPIKE